MADSTKKAKEAQAVKSLADLHNELATKRQDLLQAKKSSISGELVNKKAIKNYRKDIARLLTEIKERNEA